MTPRSFRPAAARGPRPILYMFRSEKNAELNAFAASASGERLPPKYAPWIGTGSLSPHAAPPFGLSRAAVEKGVAANGFQLWRRTKTS
jgi:hypothetical protein